MTLKLWRRVQPPAAAAAAATATTATTTTTTTTLLSISLKITFPHRVPPAFGHQRHMSHVCDQLVWDCCMKVEQLRLEYMTSRLCYANALTITPTNELQHLTLSRAHSCTNDADPAKFLPFNKWLVKHRVMWGRVILQHRVMWGRVIVQHRVMGPSYS